jgi:hypothetical protein
VRAQGDGMAGKHGENNCDCQRANRGRVSMEGGARWAEVISELSGGKVSRQLRDLYSAAARGDRTARHLICGLGFPGKPARSALTARG